MICKDMKYTALYWALGFEETEQDIYVKKYPQTEICIDAEEQTVYYGKDIRIDGNNCKYLKRHKDFVILECIDRLLQKGYSPCDMVLDGEEEKADIHIRGLDVFCEQWGRDYQEKLDCYATGKSIIVLYTSRLTSGLLEYQNRIYHNGEIWDKGVFEDGIEPFDWTFARYETIEFRNAKQLGFKIFDRELIAYDGKNRKVVVPEGITAIAASAFWNNTSVEEVVLPQSLEKFGGDSFYYCKNLKRINIPPKVRLMGNNPFAGCPNVRIINQCANYVVENGVLYNKDKTAIIYYPISKKAKTFEIPEGIKIIGKHSFFACNNLRKVTIPSSVIHLENNPFSGCDNLEIVNRSANYIFDQGVIYNKYRTAIIGCLNGTEADEIIIPETVKAINRNSFWNCKGIKRLVIPQSVTRIGYNPFAGCKNMILCGSPVGYKIDNGIIFSVDGSAICCATDKAVGEEFIIPQNVKTINRGVFSGCERLKQIDFSNVTYIDKSAFTNCTGLEYVFIPDNVMYIGEWAFAYCINLKKISVKIGTVIDRNAFNECPAQIEWRAK